MSPVMKVISKDITVKSLEDITEVLKRPPVIWDNEHANDYDQKRLYLGAAMFPLMLLFPETSVLLKY